MSLYRTAVILLVSLVFSFPSSAGSPQVSGPATVISGDTLEVAGQRFRLFGIAAPKLAQTCQWPDKVIPCGDVSRTALMDLVVAAQVDCAVTDNEAPQADGTTLARCYVDGFDVGKNMVHTGWAVVFTQESGAYQDTEDKARAAKRGLWKGEFQLPWVWHAGD
jgi:endonuclease YncB( thermonuclease family)